MKDKVLALTKLILLVFLSLGSFCFGVVLGKNFSDHIYQKELIKLTQKLKQLDKEQNLYQKEKSIKLSRNLIQKQKRKIKEETMPTQASVPQLKFKEKKTNQNNKIKEINHVKEIKEINHIKEIKLPEKVKPKTAYIYTLQIASFRKEKEAQKYVYIHRQQGWTCFYRLVLLDKKTWYRVFLGQFESKQKALQFQKQLSKKSTTIKQTLLKKIKRRK